MTKKTTILKDQYDLAIAGLVILGLRLRTMVMDRPSTYVCRIQKTPALFFPSNVETTGARLGALLALVMQVKQLVCQTLSLVNEPALVVSQSFDDSNRNEGLPFSANSQ